MTLRATFQPAAAKGVRTTFELHVMDVVVHALVDDGTLRAAAGSVPDPDLVIEPGLAFKELMSGALSPADAIAGGAVRLTGDAALLGQFTELFRIARKAEINA
jgi:SCP-2 sterol transfer family protein